jgi:hypothetical protein
MLKAEAAATDMLTVNRTSFPVESVTTTASIRELKQNPAFCKGWPCAKSVLQILSDLLKGPWAPLYKTVISILIGIGDKVCG